MTEARRSSYDHAGLLAVASGELFGEDGPKLPQPPMLMFERIVHVAADDGKFGRGSIIAEFDISPEQWFFQCHFTRDPVMPGCLGLDAMWQLTGFFLGWLGHKGRGRALGVKEVRFSGQVLPTNAVVRYELDIKRVIDRRLTLAIAEGVVKADGEPIYSMSDLRVGLFSEGIEPDS